MAGLIDLAQRMLSGGASPVPKFPALLLVL